MNLSKWILKIHLYGGLLCFWYIIIFAVSSLQFHHHFDFMKNDGESTTEEVKLEIPESKTDSALAVNIQNALGIPGWHLYWKTYTDSTGVFHTEIQNPNKQYRIAYDKTSGRAQVETKVKGFWSVFNALHGFAGEMPNAPLLSVWTAFTYLCLISVLFSIVSGIWLWANRGADKLVGWVTMSGIMGLSFLLMVIVYLKG